MTDLVHALPAIGEPGAPMVTRLAPARERWSWALYEFANTIFSMNIATLYFAVWLVSDLHGSNTDVAIGNGLTSILVMFSIPVLGAVSDVTRRRKPWVVGFTLVAVAATVAIGAVGQYVVPLTGDSVIGATTAAYVISGAPLVFVIAAFVAANYAYQSALPFYNAMMPELAPPERWGQLSGLGVILGYTGSILGVLMIKPFFDGALPLVGQLPVGFIHTIRTVFPFAHSGGRVSTFSPTALLYLVFSIPLFLFCKDHFPERTRQSIPWRQAFSDVAHTIRESRKYPGVLRFLIASFVYQDAMGTIISFMALYAVVAMGFQRGSETTLFVVLTIPAVFGAWLWGRLTDRIGPKNTITIVLIAWIVLLIAMIVAPSRQAFWIVGAMIGFIYGGLNVAERPMLLRLIPDEEAGRFFGLMVLSARAAAIAGPLIWALAVDGLMPSFGKAVAYRAGVATVAVAMCIALIILRGIPDNFRPATK
ncbi:MAG: MFS transporter [Gemmatimonadota bacterium]|nr:MFS transporter [Gemmatimonadota bacterium]